MCCLFACLSFHLSACLSRFILISFFMKDIMWWECIGQNIICEKQIVYHHSENSHESRIHLNSLGRYSVKVVRMNSLMSARIMRDVDLELHKADADVHNALQMNLLSILRDSWFFSTYICSSRKQSIAKLRW